jgi:extracellular elastinolytic metalloproteinase
MNSIFFTPKRLLFLFACLLSANIILAQSQTPLDIALRHIENNHLDWGLSDKDIADISVSDSHISSISGTAHIYFQQKYQGINIYNGILNVAVGQNGNIVHTGKNMVKDIASKISTTTPAIDMLTALNKGLENLQIERPASLLVKENRSSIETVFDKANFAKRDIIVKLIYVKTADDKLQLVWDYQIDPAGPAFEAWQFQIDATTGEISHKINRVLSCNHSSGYGHQHSASCSEDVATAPEKDLSVKEALASANSSVVLNSYRVFGLPTESPIHGPHVLVTSPADATASPLGWHDNGSNQWTITRGNNTHALLNLDGDPNNIPDQPEPDGGATFDFDFPYDPMGEPIDNTDAATVNLFYMANVMHDWTYLNGFDEAAGNFQDNNFGNGGAGNDHIVMNAQYGATTGSLNNAFYSHAPDGQSPFVAMFVWSADNGTGLLNVTAPGTIAGTYPTGTAAFGPPVTTTPICGEVVIVNDGVFDPYNTDGCEPDFINNAELNGKIAIIDRGGCFFQDKVLHAEANGAIAVIICNFEEGTIGMGAAGGGNDPTIPAVMIGNSDCQTIRQFAGNGLEACLQEPIQTGPDFADGDFDNGIIAHEIGHGVSIRMTGGPNSGGGCLSNAEQMGEGWSDFFGIAATVKAGDTGDMPRGVGNYAVKLPVDGGGIRRHPYSTDMTVSPLTYADVALSTEVHDVGEVWCNMIWDLYWAMSDEHGWDPDLYYGTGGNNMAVRLVVEGIKTQQCSPGFVSGRDAILAADMALYNGANQCLIWDVFARRGCGFYADEGSTENAGDQTESFESRPTCIEALKIKKSVTDLINAGDEIEVTVTVTNHKPEPSTLTNIVVTDQLISGLSYVNGSVSANISDVTVNGNQVNFTVGDMAYLDEIVFTYSLASSPDNYSIRKEYDDVEYNLDGSLDWWLANTITPPNQFDLSGFNPHAGEQCWFIPEASVASQNQLIGEKIITIDGNRPVIRFYSDYFTEGGQDGGTFEISTNNGTSYEQVGEHMIRGAYPGGLDYQTFVVPNLSGFSGDSEGYIGTYVDMSSYAGQQVRMRFQFATSDAGTVGNGGWWIDDIEYMDLYSYNTITCVTSNQGDNACVSAAEEGTIVESQISTSTSNPEATVQLGVYPNPAHEVVNVTIGSKFAQQVEISLVTLDGRVVRNNTITTSQNTQTFALDVANLPAGFYLVRAATPSDVLVQKVVVN